MSGLHQGKYGLQSVDPLAGRRGVSALQGVGSELAFAGTALLVAVLLSGTLRFLGVAGPVAIPRFVLVNLCALSLLIVSGLCWFQHTLDRFEIGGNELLRRVAVLFGLASLETVGILYLVEAKIGAWIPVLAGTLALASFLALLSAAAINRCEGIRAALWVGVGSSVLVLGQIGLESSSVQLLWPTEAFVALVRFGADAGSVGGLFFGAVASPLWLFGVAALLSRAVAPMRVSI